MSELVAWLRAQLDEDEAHASKDIWCAERSSNGGHWQARYGYNLPSSELWAGGEIGRLTATHGRALADGAEDQHAADAMFVARMVRSAKRRAERMLREVEAKRRIMDLREAWAAAGSPAPSADLAVRFADQVHAADMILCLLALPYADRPGYRQEWTP